MADMFGADEARERLIIVMGGLAGEMASIQMEPGQDRPSLVSRDVVRENELRMIASTEAIEFVQLEDVVMHSLLQPAGRDPRSRERLLRFAHRSFQDWFLARHFALNGRDESVALPGSVARFLSPMKEDLLAGMTLP
jgi:hypothetical protein